MLGDELGRDGGKVLARERGVDDAVEGAMVRGWVWEVGRGEEGDKEGERGKRRGGGCCGVIEVVLVSDVALVFG